MRCWARDKKNGEYVQVVAMIHPDSGGEVNDCLWLVQTIDKIEYIANDASLIERGWTS